MDNLHEYFLAFMVLSILYGVLMTLWGVNWYKHRSNSGIGLHRYIGFTLAFQCLAMLILVVYYPVRWREAENDESTQQHSHAYYLAMTFQVLAVGAITVFYSMLIVISLGWCIIENTLNSNRILGLAAFILAYFIVEVLRVETPYYTKTFIYLLYLELVLFIGMLIFVSVKTNDHIRRLSLQIKPDADVHVDTSDPSKTSLELSDISRPNVPLAAPAGVYSIDGEEDEDEGREQRREGDRDGESRATRIQNADGGESATLSAEETMTIPEAREKLKLFNYFYKLVALYILLSAVFKYFDSSPYAAAAVICSMYWDFMFLCGICYVFRLRNANQYFYLVNQE